MYKIEVLKYDSPEQMIKHVTDAMAGNDKMIVVHDESHDQFIFIGAAKVGEEIMRCDEIEAHVICETLNKLPQEIYKEKEERNAKSKNA